MIQPTIPTFRTARRFCALPATAVRCWEPPDRGSAGLYLSEAIHGFHAGQSAPNNAAIACYDCHPGQTTQCSRSLAHTAPDGNCIDCHGTMGEMAAQITSNTKVPWVNEPKCIECHSGVAEVDTGAILYRNAMGHGGLYCAGCHQSPHAMIPSREAADNYQAQQYQDASVTIGSCRACHNTSKPEGGNLGEFRETHAGSSPEARICLCGLPHRPAGQCQRRRFPAPIHMEPALRFVAGWPMRATKLRL